MSPSISRLLLRFYGVPRRSLRRIILRCLDAWDGGMMGSLTLREIFRRYHGVDIGLYTHGGCFVPGQFDRHTSVGRYCSIAMDVRVMNRNHPMNFRSMHGLFFNPRLGVSGADRIEYIPLEIGNDVWIGHGAIILPAVRKIGDGAVIGAGSVLNKDVPPYAVVVGNPARVVRFRFSRPTIEALLASRWWDSSPEELMIRLNEFEKPLETSAEGAEAPT